MAQIADHAASRKWAVRSWSLFGTVLPTISVCIGLCGIGAAVVDLFVALASSGRATFLWLIPCGVFAIFLGSIPLFLSVREVELQQDGVMTFRSRLKQHTIPPGGLRSIVGLPMVLDTWRIYPVLVRATDEHFLMIRQLQGGEELERALQSTNRSLILKRSLYYQ